MVLAWAIYSGIPLIAMQYNINVYVYDVLLQIHKSVCVGPKSYWLVIFDKSDQEQDLT